MNVTRDVSSVLVNRCESEGPVVLSKAIVFDDLDLGLRKEYRYGD